LSCAIRGQKRKERGDQQLLKNKWVVFLKKKAANKSFFSSSEIKEHTHTHQTKQKQRAPKQHRAREAAKDAQR
jgi:hypothetical protein